MIIPSGRQFAFAQVVRVDLGVLQQVYRFGRIVKDDGLDGHFNQRGHVLLRHFALSALPGVEGVVKQLVQRLGVAAKQVEQRDIFDEQIVTLLDQIEVRLKGIEPLGRRIAQPLAQLIEFEEDARIGRIEGKGSFVGQAGALGVVPFVHVGQAQIAEDDGEAGIECGRRFPAGDGFFVATAGVPEVAQIVGRTSIIGAASDGRSPRPAHTRFGWGSSSRATPAAACSKASRQRL